MLPGFEILEYGFVVRALLAGLIAGAVAASLGVFLVLRGSSMMGDGIAHIAFGGIAFGLYANLFPFGAALVFAVVAAVGIQLLQQRGVVLTDTAIAIFFTTGLAVGLVLVSFAGGFSVDLFSFLFGSLVAVRASDLPLLAGLAAVVGLLVAALYKEWFYLTFDEPAARVSGLPVAALNLVFAALTAVVIVVTARVVGLLLVSALLVVPAATALQLSGSFRRALVLSILLAMLAVVAGLYASFAADLPLGAAIALVSVACFFAAAAARGVRKSRPIKAA